MLKQTNLMLNFLTKDAGLFTFQHYAFRFCAIVALCISMICLLLFQYHVMCTQIEMVRHEPVDVKDVHANTSRSKSTHTHTQSYRHFVTFYLNKCRFENVSLHHQNRLNVFHIVLFVQCCYVMPWNRMHANEHCEKKKHEFISWCFREPTDDEMNLPSLTPSTRQCWRSNLNFFT